MEQILAMGMEEGGEAIGHFDDLLVRVRVRSRPRARSPWPSCRHRESPFVLAAMEMMIEAEGLTKHFGDVEALAGLDLAVPSGKVLAVLGPNGAGKTTFIRTIATLTRADAGHAARRRHRRGRRTRSECGAPSVSRGSTRRSSPR